MAFGLYFGEDVLDFAVGSDDECGAGDTHHFLAVHIFLLHDAVSFGNLFVGIGQQGKWQFELILKFFLRFGSVGGNAEEHSAGFLNLLVGVAEGAGLDCASGRVRAGIEIEHDYFAAQVFERDFLCVLVVQSKLGSLIIDVDIHEHLISK